MTYNYHTHTFRCGHASGKPEDYIKRAIENGITHMGFSDHVPYICSNGVQSDYRVPVSEVQDYFSEIYALRERYKDKIDIKIGFEMEYYPNHFEKMLKNAISYGAEYLILGVHFMDEENPDWIASIYENNDIKLLESYVFCVTEAIKSGVFTYVAHPDIFNFTGDSEIYIEKMRKICTESRNYNIPLEINFLGIRDNRIYPNEKFWEIAGEEKSPVTFGFDAHDVLNAFDGASLKRAEEIVEKYGLNYIGKPEIRKLK